VGAVDLGGGEGGDVGTGHGEAELVGAEETDLEVALLRVSLGAMKRTMVQSRSDA
jgi:hypothetical protein